MRYGKLVRVFLACALAAILQASVAGCRDEPVYPDTMTGPPQALCVETDLARPNEVALVSPACGGKCRGNEGASWFTVNKDSPISFLLYGSSGTEYCVEISRTSGYITISHERGTVTRSGDLFTWCITPTASEDPEFMTVRSFTASADFNLAVP